MAKVKGRVKVMWRVRVRGGLGLERTNIKEGGATYRDVEQHIEDAIERVGGVTYGDRGW